MQGQMSGSRGSPTFCGAPRKSSCCVAPVPGAGVPGYVVHHKRKLATPVLGRLTLISCAGDSQEQHQHPPHPPHSHQPRSHLLSLTKPAIDGIGGASIM